MIMIVSLVEGHACMKLRLLRASYAPRRVKPDRTLLRRVCVGIGVLTGVSPDAMRFYFDAVQPGHAELEVAVEPLRATRLGWIASG
jgi:hypothetical protein